MVRCGGAILQTDDALRFGGRCGMERPADGQEHELQHDVRATLRRGLRTADIAAPGDPVVGTAAMGDAVVAALR